MSNIRSLSEDDSPPHLKEYNFEYKLGSGTYANVYKAHDKTSKNDVVAIKCIKRNSLNEISTENLLREIEILKNIKHDYIVQLKDFQWDSKYVYLIMEYCAGGDLSSFIRSKRTISENYVKRFVQQIASALKHLHSIKIAHMDLKPQNILITSVDNPSLKLADFGFAQQLKGKVGKSMRGSPLYMAPEILKCRAYDAKVDLWSVGVILYEVIFGYAPFISNSFEELERKILDEKPIQIPSHISLSNSCKDLLKRLLQRNPDYRISFEQFFDHPFIDLEHMPCSESITKAMNLLKSAKEADSKTDHEFAHQTYLRCLEYMIPAIQYETNPNKKHELRVKAKQYLNRAEELARIINPQSLTTKLESNNGSPLDDNQKQLSSSRSTSASNENQIQRLFKLIEGDEEISEALKMCIKLETSEAYDSYRLDTLLNEYQNMIAILLSYLEKQPKDMELYQLLKKFISKWLTNAEKIKEKIQFHARIRQLDEQKVDDDSSSIKQCQLQ